MPNRISLRQELEEQRLSKSLKLAKVTPLPFKVNEVDNVIPSRFPTPESALNGSKNEETSTIPHENDPGSDRGKIRDSEKSFSKYGYHEPGTPKVNTLMQDLPRLQIPLSQSTLETGGKGLDGKSGTVSQSFRTESVLISRSSSDQQKESKLDEERMKRKIPHEESAAIKSKLQLEELGDQVMVFLTSGVRTKKVKLVVPTTLDGVEASFKQGVKVLYHNESVEYNFCICISCSVLPLTDHKKYPLIFHFVRNSFLS